MGHMASRSRYRASVLIAVMLSGMVCATASAKLINYVIVVSMDGLRPDAITNLGATNAPNFYRFRTEGAFTDNARTDYDYTETLPNHCTIMTGRGVVGTSGHNWTGNDDPAEGDTLATNKGSYIAGVFDVVHDYGLRTGLYAGKSKFSLFDVSWNAANGATDGVSPDNGQDKIDNYLIMADSSPLVNTMVANMESQAMNLAFIHFRDPDLTGHGDGWDPTVNSAYSNTVVDMDDRLGTIFNMVENNPTFNGRTVIIMTADHGGTGTAHAAAGTAANYTIPFYVWGPVVSAGEDLYDLNSSTRQDPGTSRPTYSASPQPIRNGEATNLGLKLLGLPAISGSTIGSSQNLDVNTASGSAPSAPTANSATSVTNCSFTANWNSATGATGYLIDVATNSSFTNYVSGYQDINVGDVVSLNVTGLAASTTYYYRVWAYNLDGTSSSSSSTINLTTSSNVYAPSTPTIAAATNVTSTGFAANWYVACGATGYRLDVSTSATFSSYVSGYQNLDVGNVISKTITNLNPSTTYYYRVRAYNGIGTSSDSGTANTTTLDVNYCVPSTLLQYGNMEFEEGYSVCPQWSSYSAGVGAPSWAKEATIIHGGAASQRARNINGGAGSIIGVRQTFDANVGDAFTFDCWVYPETNPAYAQAAMAARWDGGTSIPDGSASWKISGGARLTWTHVQNFSGNATSTSVTLFLDSRRTTGSVAITAYWDDVISYRAYVPPAPTVTVAGSTSLYVNPNYGCNSDNTSAEYAVTIGGGAYTEGTHWVQANGTVNTTTIWQTDATWGTKTVTGLTTGIAYTFKTKARYSSTLTQATSLGAGATGTPSGGSSPPTITQHPSAQNICPGTNATFTVAASGSGTLTYQWQKTQTNISNGGHYSGCTTATLTVSSADTNDVANYRCKVTDTNGSTNSNEAALSLKTATSITTHPSNQSISSGGTAIFSVVGAGEGTLTYQWQKDSVNQSNGGHYSGCTTATLTVSSADTNDEADYRCVVTAMCGSATSNQASLTITSCITTSLLNGNFEDWPSGGIAPNWTGAYSSTTPSQFARMTSPVHGGSYSQKIKARDEANAWCHVYQGFATNVGDAITITAYAYPTAVQAGVNPQVGVNTSSSRPASWLRTLTSFTKNTWCSMGTLTCNAAGTTTYLFLDIKRVGAVDTTTYWDDAVVYRAQVPPAPTVAWASSTSLNVNVDPGCNSTNSSAEYAITVSGGAYTEGTHWVQANGSVSTSAVWQTDATWGNKTVTGLSTGTTYTFKVKARYSNSYTMPTSLGSGATGTP